MTQVMGGMGGGEGKWEGAATEELKTVKVGEDMSESNAEDFQYRLTIGLH